MANYTLSLFSKSLILFFSFLVFSFLINAQESHQIWRKLLQNDRKEALDLINSINTEDDIELLMLKKLVQMENGIMKSDLNLIENLSQYPNYENYLFSNWMLPYFFNNYIENGFDSLSLSAPHKLDVSKISNSTIRNSLYYLKAITNRHQQKFSEYYSLIDNINAIRDWEYCGVFENLNSSGIDIPYAPENDVSPATVFDARSKGETQWYKPTLNNEVYQFYTNHSEFGSGVHYAQTFVSSPDTQRVNLKLGKNGLTRLWINDVLVVENDSEYITEMDALTYSVTLQKGVNRFLVKSATNGKTPYFIVRLEDENGGALKNLDVSFKNRNYVRGTLKSINPVFVPHSIETFFKEKLKDPRNDINLNRFCLFQVYFRNGQMEDAILLLKDWLEKYPNSSFIKSCLIECYSKIEDNPALEKLQNNIKRIDPNYYVSLMLEFDNFDDLMKLDIQTYESKLRKIGESVDYSYMKTMAEFMILLRQNNREKMKKALSIFLADKLLPSSFKHTFAEFYSTVFNDDELTIETLEEFNKTEYNFKVIQFLAHYYNKQNRTEDAIQLYLNSLEKYNDDNNVHYKLINLLHDKGDYQRSLTYINQALENFPNSYVFTKLKGDAYVQLNKKEEAIKLYKLAFSRSSSDSELRAKIYDLRNKKNPLDEFHTKDSYEYIRKYRNTIERNNYGLNNLLRQTDVLNYKNGGGEYRTTLIYEITAQNGIDIFKEYSLGLSGNYSILKSEIVKQNGDTVPAERNGSDLVFSELEIGDVIYIDYNKYYTRKGRFYNDYILSNNFNGYHPSIKYVYRLLTHDKKVNYSVKNGAIEYKSYKKDEFYVHEWSNQNIKGIPISEDYMPRLSDVVTKLHISSIDSWNEIAIWYSDIVRKQVEFDQIVKNTFNEIFPNGFNHLSETERAKRIYYFITNNLNYSYVSFRQSGFVPQKPSKTIKTKLGDCKDFSALFLVLAQQANLNAKMVLILTSDYGQNNLVLPSSDFNHCIVKVDLDGKNQFLELTDKYLPFRSLPTSLRDATALEIPYNNNQEEESNLFKLSDVQRLLTNFKSNYIMNLKEEMTTIELTTNVSGHLASTYIDIFENKKDELLKERVQEELLSRASETIKLVEIKNVNNNIDVGEITYDTALHLDLKVNKIGDLYTFKAPHFLNPYNYSIINLEERYYPIDYIQYENADTYQENILLKIEDNKKFVEIPKDVNYKFKAHEFSITYELIKKNELKININSKVNSDSINKEEYSEYKIFVESVLNTRDTFIVYKLVE